MNLRFVTSVVGLGFWVQAVAQTLHPVCQVSAVLLAKEPAGGQVAEAVGSGFFLNVNSNWFLVTAKHVLYPPGPGSNVLGSELVASNLVCVFYTTTGTNEDRGTCRILCVPCSMRESSVLTPREMWLCAGWE